MSSSFTSYLLSTKGLLQEEEFSLNISNRQLKDDWRLFDDLQYLIRIEAVLFQEEDRFDDFSGFTRRGRTIGAISGCGRICR